MKECYGKDYDTALIPIGRLTTQIDESKFLECRIELCYWICKDDAGEDYIVGFYLL